MAEKVQTCGSKTIRYPSSCSYSCVCPAGNTPCTWRVNCGGTIFTGSGLTSPAEPGKPPHASVEGALGDIATMLAKAWQRRVTVPPRMRGQKIRKRTLKGSPEEIAAALGLRLGPPTKRKEKPPKGDYVWIKS
jgi:hypothetical protein